MPSLLRGFTAPVKLSANLKERDLVFLMRHDSDSFNRWEAAQRFGSRLQWQQARPAIEHAWRSMDEEQRRKS